MNKLFVVAIIALGIGALGFTFAFYFYYGGFVLQASDNNSDWGSFGSYFGGVAGPALAFLSAVLLAGTLIEQRTQSRFIHNEALKQGISSSLNNVKLEIDSLLYKTVQTNKNRAVEYWAVVNRVSVHPNPMDGSLVALNDKLLKLTAYYCELLHSYEEDFESDLFFKLHCRYARELIDYLKRSHHSNHMAKVTLSYCDLFVEGKTEEAEKAKEIKDILEKIGRDKEIFNSVKNWMDSKGRDQPA